MLRRLVQLQVQLARLVQRRVIVHRAALNQVTAVLLLVQHQHTALRHTVPLQKRLLLQEQARHLTVLLRVQLHRVRGLDVAQDA
jgi:hypothetical protein